MIGCTSATDIVLGSVLIKMAIKCKMHKNIYNSITFTAMELIFCLIVAESHSHLDIKKHCMDFNANLGNESLRLLSHLISIWSKHIPKWLSKHNQSGTQK